MENTYSINYSFLSSRRRQMQVRRNICLLAAVAAVVLILLAVLLASISTQASELDSASENKYYKSIQIEKGDTLWSIAAENVDLNHYKGVNDYINEIKTMNSIKSDSITAGSYLIIPYFY